VRWHDVVTRVIARLNADAQFVAANGGVGRVFLLGANDAPLVPSVEYEVLSSPQLENTEPVSLRLHNWAYGGTAAAALEARQRALLDRPIAEEQDGLLMLWRYEDARSVPDPDPHVVHRVIEFTIEPTRQPWTV